jgi:hypothetical protein
MGRSRRGPGAPCHSWACASCSCPRPCPGTSTCRRCGTAGAGPAGARAQRGRRRGERRRSGGWWRRAWRTRRRRLQRRQECVPGKDCTAPRAGGTDGGNKREGDGWKAEARRLWALYCAGGDHDSSTRWQNWFPQVSMFQPRAEISAHWHTGAHEPSGLIIDIVHVKHVYAFLVECMQKHPEAAQQRRVGNKELEQDRQETTR